MLSVLAAVAAAIGLIVFGAGGTYEEPNPLRELALLAGGIGATAALCRARWAAPFVLVALAATGVALRAGALPFPGSDVLLATQEAVDELRAGHDPYAHVFVLARPPGSPFAYPPGEIVFYAIASLFGAPPLVAAERAIGQLNVVLLAALGPIAGYGTTALATAAVVLSSDVAVRATDGSNDTSAAFLVLVAIVTLAWSQRAGGRAGGALFAASAVAAGWAVAFKEYTLPLVALIALFAWRSEAHGPRWAIVAAATAALFVVPFAIWDPGAFARNVGGALFVHHDLYGRTIWNDLIGAAFPDARDAIAIAAPFVAFGALVGALTFFALRPARSLGVAVLHGCAALGTTFVLARWTTIVYVMFLLPPLAAGFALALGGRVRDADRVGV